MEAAWLGSLSGPVGGVSSCLCPPSPPWSDVLSPPPDMRACTSNPCANNGTCTTMQKGHYQCTCAPGFSGENCQKKDGPCEVNG